MYYRLASPTNEKNATGGSVYHYAPPLFCDTESLPVSLLHLPYTLVFGASSVERLDREIDFYNQGALVCAIAGTSLVRGVPFGEQEILQREQMLNQVRYAPEPNQRLKAEDARRMRWVKWMIAQGKFTDELPV